MAMSGHFLFEPGNQIVVLVEELGVLVDILTRFVKVEEICLRVTEILDE